MLSSSEVLFLGKGHSVVSWYRTGSPAFYNGCDWVGMIGIPGKLEVLSAIKRGGLTMPDFDRYKIIVVQQVGGASWMKQILQWRDKGIKVLYEADDYYPAVRKIRGHAGAKIYTKGVVHGMEQCMRVCDGMIVSTDFLARRYRQHNPRVWVCPNAVERTRFAQVTKPQKREKIHIGWAGGEGHQLSMDRWLPAVQKILDNYPETHFVSIGLPYAKKVDRPGRTTALPFVTVENVPSVLCHFDITLAPAYPNDFFRAKSNLRWLESSTLGIPAVVDPMVYQDVFDDVDGLWAESSDEAYSAIARLVGAPEVRDRIGRNAQERVNADYAIEEQCQAWPQVFMEVIDGN